MYLAFESKRKEVRTTFTIKLARRQQLNTKEYALQKSVSQCLKGYCCKNIIPVVNLQTSNFCLARMLKHCFGTQFFINWDRFVDIQEFPRLLPYVPSNQGQLSKGYENYKLVFCRIAWKGSTDKKYWKRGERVEKVIFHTSDTHALSRTAYYTYCNFLMQK